MLTPRKERLKGLANNLAVAADWNEEDHPRGEDGKFGSGGGGKKGDKAGKAATKGGEMGKMPKPLQSFVKSFIAAHPELTEHGVDEKKIGAFTSERLTEYLANSIKSDGGKMAVKVLGDKGVRKEVERVINETTKASREAGAKAHKEAVNNKAPLSPKHAKMSDDSTKYLKKEAASFKGAKGNDIYEHLRDEVSDSAQILYHEQVVDLMKSKTQGDLYVALVDDKSWEPSEALKAVNDPKFLEEKLGEEIGNWAYEDRDDAASSALDVINSWKRKK